MKYLLAILLLPLCANAQLGFVDQSGASVGVADWRTSLVGYWPLDSLNQGKALDASGNGKVGTAANNPVATNGIVGSAAIELSRVGSTNYFVAPAFLGLTNFTVLMWVKLPTNPFSTFASFLSNRSNTAAATGIMFCTGHSGKERKIRIQLNSATAANDYNLGVSSIPTNVWTQIGMAVDVAQNKYFAYFNTAVDFSGALPSGNISSGVNLGIGIDAAFAPNAGAYCFGTLDDVRIYNRALTTNEISAIYRWGWGSHANTPVHP